MVGNKPWTPFPLPAQKSPVPYSLPKILTVTRTSEATQQFAERKSSRHKAEPVARRIVGEEVECLPPRSEPCLPRAGTPLETHFSVETFQIPEQIEQKLQEGMQIAGITGSGGLRRSWICLRITAMGRESEEGRAAAPLGCRRWGEDLDGCLGWMKFQDHPLGWMDGGWSLKPTFCVAETKSRNHHDTKQTPHSSPSLPFPLSHSSVYLHASKRSPAPLWCVLPLYLLFSTTFQVQCTPPFMVFSVTCIKVSLTLFWVVCQVTTQTTNNFSVRVTSWHVTIK